MDLTCYLIDDFPVEIRPAPNRREWMNQTPGSYAYRCLPLSIANAHGWEFCSPVTCEAEWDGGSGKDAIEVTFEGGDDAFVGSRRVTNFVETHFGSGILTFSVGVVMGTPPGYDLWVTGPTNRFKDGIQALSAVVETYWMPFTFTMNWKFTRPHTKVRFEKGEPFCFFFPIQHGFVESVDPRFEELSDHPALERQYRFALSKRELVPALKRLRGDAMKIPERDRFEGWYIKGETPDDGTQIEGHKRRLELRPFEHRRTP